MDLDRLEHPMDAQCLRPSRFLITLILVVAAITPAAAQDAARSLMAQTLRVGQQVRVQVASSNLLEGRLLEATNTALVLARPEGAVPIRIPEIKRLWVRGHATGKGALIGAGIGVVVGVIGGVLISTVACEPIDGGNCTAAELATITGLGAGAGGALIGAGVGALIPVWRLRFP